MVVGGGVGEAAGVVGGAEAQFEEGHWPGVPMQVPQPQFVGVPLTVDGSQAHLLVGLVLVLGEQ